MTSMIVERRTSLRGEPAVAVGQPVEAPVEPVARDAQRPQSSAGPHRASSVRCGFSSSAASAGDRVSETSVEITAAAAMVTANWR